MHAQIPEKRRPPFPLGLEHVYEAYADLSLTRDIGMAAGAITFREIGAYNAETLACLRAWDVKLIRRIDTAIRSGAEGKPSKTDVGSMRATLRAAAARLAKRNEQSGAGDAVEKA